MHLLFILFPGRNVSLEWVQKQDPPEKACHSSCWMELAVHVRFGVRAEAISEQSKRYAASGCKQLFALLRPASMYLRAGYRFYMKRELNQKNSGDEVCCTNSVTLLVKNILCCKFHCQRDSDLILFSYEIHPAGYKGIIGSWAANNLLGHPKEKPIDLQMAHRRVLRVS